MGVEHSVDLGSVFLPVLEYPLCFMSIGDYHFNFKYGLSGFDYSKHNGVRTVGIFSVVAKILLSFAVAQAVLFCKLSDILTNRGGDTDKEVRQANSTVRGYGVERTGLSVLRCNVYKSCVKKLN